MEIITFSTLFILLVILIGTRFFTMGFRMKKRIIICSIYSLLTTSILYMCDRLLFQYTVLNAFFRFIKSTFVNVFYVNIPDIKDYYAMLLVVLFIIIYLIYRIVFRLLIKPSDPFKKPKMKHEDFAGFFLALFNSLISIVLVVLFLPSFSKLTAVKLGFLEPLFSLIEKVVALLWDQ